MIEVGETIGKVLIWLAGLVGAVSLISSKVLPLRRWLGQRWGRWVDSSIGAKIDERLNYRNAGNSFRDQIDRLEKGMVTLHTCVDELRAGAEHRGELIKERLERIDERIDRIDERTDRLEDIAMRRPQ